MNGAGPPLASFRGRGWSFPLGVDGRGGIMMAGDEIDIQQSIRIILGTAKGERRMRSTFGSSLHELVFAPNNATTASLASHYVREALGQWEPRIEVVEVDVTADPLNAGRLLIDIRYRLRDTNDERNLVYPFYRIVEEE